MYYLEAVKQIGGAPRKVRSDDGTENSLVEALHTYLIFSTTNNDVHSSCFAIGRSTTNQRIEAYWSQLVKDGPGWWINFLKICGTCISLMIPIMHILNALDFVSCIYCGKSCIKSQNYGIST